MTQSLPPLGGAAASGGGVIVAATGATATIASAPRPGHRSRRGALARWATPVGLR
jgi:hypothetical protein